MGTQSDRVSGLDPLRLALTLAGTLIAAGILALVLAGRQAQLSFGNHRLASLHAFIDH